MILVEIIQLKGMQNDDDFIVTCCGLLWGFILRWSKMGVFFQQA
jgi:hypothetical protein